MGVPTIVDCDPGVDDILALLLLLSDSDVDLLAYFPQFGNTDLDNAHDNILKMYGVLDKHLQQFPDQTRFPGLERVRHAPSSKPIIVKGASGPVSGKSHTAKYFHGDDGLGNISSLYTNEIVKTQAQDVSRFLTCDTSGKPGHEVILDLLAKQEDGSVSYIALGPLTNLARLIQANEDLFKRKVGRVTIMGGALDVPGNTSPVAEFNVYADASAAHEVFSHHASLPIFLLPLDITTDHMMHWSKYTERVDSGFPISSPDPALPPIAFFTSAFLRHTSAIMKKYGKSGMELHDPLAVWFALLHPPGKPLQEGWEIEKVEFAVERYGEYTAGMCVQDKRRLAKGEKGKSRAELQEQIDHEAVRAQVDEEAEAHVKDLEGVNVVVATPGSQAFVDELLRRIWGA